MSASSNSQEICVLCCREIRIFAAGNCDHSICHECSSRMRVLGDQRECPICRSDMPVVVFTKSLQAFKTPAKNYPFMEKKLKIAFENEDIEKAFYRLLENNCKFCKASYRTLTQLRDHVRREHEYYYCDLCIENLMIFPFERECYNRKELAQHRRVGDPDNTSHRGHPLCEFCDIRYVDNDELFRHLRREHFFCHFCDADGKNHYYKDHNFLKMHFRKEHHLCEEGECATETFTGAFRSSIDLQAHKALHHTKNKSKAEVKQARTLELEFTIAPRSSQNGFSSQYSEPKHSRYSRQNQQRKANIEDNAIRESDGFSEHPRHAGSQVTPGPNKQSFNMQSEQEFPHLSVECGSNAENSEVFKSNDNQSASYGRQAGARPGNIMKNEDFPALPNATIPANLPRPISGSRYATSASRESPGSMRRTFQTADIPKPKMPTSRAFIHEVEASRLINQCSSINSANSELKAEKPRNLPPFQVEGPDVSNSKGKDNSSWVVPAKKVSSFEENFPALHPKRVPITHSVEPKRVPITHPVEPKRQPEVSKTLVQGNINYTTKKPILDQQAAAKSKSKKKKKEKSVSENESKYDDHKQKVEPLPISIQFNSTSSTESENQENEDPSVHSSNISESISTLSIIKSKDVIDEPKLNQQPVNLEEDFPPLPGAAAPKQKNPPGFSSSEAPLPPPGFSTKNANVCPLPSSVNISLSSVARQLTSGENGHLRTIAKGNELYKNVLLHVYQQPSDFQQRNAELVKLVHLLVGEDSSSFTDFKHWSGQFRQNLISADDYHARCLDIIGRDGFLNIINELIALLPDISKQKELLTVHKSYVEQESKTRGAVPKWNCVNSSSPVVPLMVCAICQQVLVKRDYESHQNSHSNDFCSLKA